jgi:hypothetical protein
MSVDLRPPSALAEVRDLVKGLSQARLRKAEHRENEELHFSALIPLLTVIRRIGLAISKESADEWPPRIVDQTLQVYKDAANQVARMEKFQVERNDAYATHRDIHVAVENLYNRVIGELRQWIRPGLDAIAQSAILETELTRVREARKALEQAQARAEELVATAETLSGDLAAGSLASHYEQQASDHRKTASKFLGAAAIAATILLGGAFALLLTIDHGETVDWTNYARQLSVRLFVLGLGTYTVTFLIRGYRTNQHLRVVNDQKTNALKTFRLFQESAGQDDGTRDLVTAELVRAVFSADETGYLDQVPDRTIVDGQSGLIALLARGPSKS